MAWPNYSPQPPLSNAWYVEPTRVTNVVTGQVYTTLLYASGTSINSNTAIAEALRRSKIYGGIDQIIYLADGETFDAPRIQGADNGDAGDTNYAFWGNTTNGTFTPIHNVFLMSNPLDPAIVNGTVNYGNKIMAANGAVTTPPAGSLDRVYWYGVQFDVGVGVKHHWTSTNAGPSSYLDVQGSLGAVMCTFTGNQGWAGSGTDHLGNAFDCKSAIRAGFASWKFHDCEFPTCGEHCIYIDAPQGHCEIWYCENTSSTGTAGAATGNTFCQIPQRGLNPNNPNNHGGLPGVGYISIIGNRTHGIAWNNSSANITIVGFMGDGGVLIEDHITDRNYGGEIVFWTAAGDGGFNTFGPFDPQANPNNYQQGAFVTRSAIVRGYQSNLSSPWKNKTAPFKFSGVENIEIEDFSIANLSGQRVPFAFWDVGNETSLGNDPWDNGQVLFRCPPVTVPVSQYAGFSGISGNAKKARWKNSTTSFTDTQLDALANRNSAYPPGGGPPPPPPNAPLYSKARSGFRARSSVQAPTTSTYAKVRSGARSRVSVVDHPMDCWAKVRTGYRARAVVGDSPFSPSTKVRSGYRARATVEFSTIIIPEAPPIPDRIYRPAGELMAPGSEGGCIAVAGSQGGQLGNA